MEEQGYLSPVNGKRYRLAPEQMRKLVSGHGACVASDRILVDGLPVGYMERNEPDGAWDSGWFFLSGDEPQEYLDDVANHGVYNVNTVANYDPDIIPLLDAPPGAAFSRDPLTGALVPHEG